MHSKLSKPPLTYVLAQIRFTSIEDIAQYIPQLQGKVRDLFPHYQPVNIQTVRLREGQQPSTAVLTQWHFIDKEKKTGIILDKQTLTIHTSCYSQFQSLLENFETVVVRFHEILNFSLFTRLGLRYINFIEDGLAEIDIRLQGFQLEGNKFKKNQFLTKTETTQYTEEGIMRIQATRIGDKQIINSIQNIFVPPDLIDTANLLIFPERKKIKQDFLLLDIDHSNSDQDDFKVKEILNRFNQLQEVVYQGFCQAVGQVNLSHWE